MATTTSYNSTARNWQDSEKEYWLSRQLTVPANTVANDVFQALLIPAGTLVTQVKVIIITAGAGTTFTVDVGDDAGANSWDAAIDLKGTANTVYSSLEATDAYGPGKYYSAANTIDIKTNTATSVTGACTLIITACCIDQSKGKAAS